MTQDPRFAARNEDRDGSIDRRTLLTRAAGLGVATAALPGFLAACSDSSSTPAASTAAWNGQPVTQPFGLSFQGPPHRGGTLKWAYQYPPIPQLDPQLPTNGTNADLNILLNVYDQLTNLVPGQLRNGPGLAEHWEIDPAGLNYTFYLRDAEFSNGDTVTGADVAFSLNRFANPNINSQYSFLSSAVESTKALDAKTVRVTLKYPQAMFLDATGHATASIVPQRVVEKLGKAFGQNPVGSGAFVLQSNTPGKSITLARNPNYRKPGQPYVDSTTFLYIPDDASRLFQVISGAADIGFPVPYAQLNQYLAVAGTRLQMEPYTNIIGGAFNLHVKPFQDVNVRLALNYAAPRHVMVTNVFMGAPLPANTALSRTKFWDPNQPALPYDPSKANALLAASSAPTGFSARLLIVETDTDSTAMATILQTAWSQIEVKLNIQTADYDTVLARVYTPTPDYDIVLFPPDYASADIGDDDDIAMWYYTPLKVDAGGFYYDVPMVTNLVGQAGSSPNQSLRRSIFERLQRYCYAVNPCGLPIALGCSRTLVASQVQGLQTQLNNSWRLENVWLNA